MRLSAGFCIAGWLAVYFSMVCVVYNIHLLGPSKIQIYHFCQAKRGLMILWMMIVQGALSLDMGRFFTGYGIGIFSYVVTTQL